MGEMQERGVYAIGSNLRPSAVGAEAESSVTPTHAMYHCWAICGAGINLAGAILLLSYTDHLEKVQFHAITTYCVTLPSL